jgi:hypothetical protein
MSGKAGEVGDKAGDVGIVLAFFFSLEVSFFLSGSEEGRGG